MPHLIYIGKRASTKLLENTHCKVFTILYSRWQIPMPLSRMILCVLPWLLTAPYVGVKVTSLPLTPPTVTIQVVSHAPFTPYKALTMPPWHTGLLWLVTVLHGVDSSPDRTMWWYTAIEGYWYDSKYTPLSRVKQRPYIIETMHSYTLPM